MLIVHSKKLLGGSEHGVYEYTTPGTYELYFKRRTKATVYMVGAGGASGWSRLYIGTSNAYNYYSGGSGSGFIGQLYIPAGTLTVKVGALATSTSTNVDTSITSSAVTGALITAGGSKFNDYYSENYEAHNGLDAGVLDVSINAEIIQGSVILNTDGTQGAFDQSTSTLKEGAASVYNGYGRGADYKANQGRNVGTTNGTNGYFKIIY